MGCASSKVVPEQHYDCVLITGASSGIGAALALRFAAPGRLLALTARSQERLDQVALACTKKGARVLTSAVDVADAAAMSAFVAQVESEAGIDLVVANAGVMAEDLPLGQALRQVGSINVTGTLNTVLPVLEAMASGRRQGRLALMSSVSTTVPGAVEFAGLLQLGLLPYTWSKAAIQSLAAGLQGELAGSGISVTVICPGVVMSALSEKASQHYNDMEQLFKSAMPAEEAAEEIYAGLVKGQDVIAFPARAVRLMRFASRLPAHAVAKQIKKSYATKMAAASEQ